MGLLPRQFALSPPLCIVRGAGVGVAADVGVGAGVDVAYAVVAADGSVSQPSGRRPLQRVI